MVQMEVISWKTLDALKQSASKIVEIFGSMDTDEQMSVFCSIEEDYFELFYSELESSYIKHFDDEEEFLNYLETRKKEFGEEEFDSMNYYDDDSFSEDSAGDDYSGFNISEEDEVDEF